MKAERIIRSMFLCTGISMMLSCKGTTSSEVSPISASLMPAVSSISPGNDATKIAVSTSISITFSTEMDQATITSGSPATCTGNVQVSPDNFSTCAAMTSGSPLFSTLLSGETIATFTPAAPLIAGRKYTIKITDIRDKFGRSIVPKVSAFTTMGPPAGMGSPGYIDISTPLGANPAWLPSTVIDTINNKLLVIFTNRANGYRPGLLRCELDGTGCAYTDISAGGAAHSGYAYSAVIDSVNRKLIVAYTNFSNANKPEVAICNLDGAACTYADISAGQGINSGEYPRVLVDATNKKLLVVGKNYYNGNKPSLFRCDLDGSGCSHADLSADQGDYSGQLPSAVIDTMNGKLLVVTTNGFNGNRPSLFRCNLDGSACTHTDISVDQGDNSGNTPCVKIDVVNRRLLVATSNGANGSRLSLFSCNLDGGACSHTDISAGQDIWTGFSPSMVIDTHQSKLLVATENGRNSYKPALFRCNLDGSSCTYTDISVGQREYSGEYPSAVIDFENGRFLVVTQNGLTNPVLGLFSN